jgi:LDH2 family malate/lactate/ureidoglycolate dehydrogenase
MARSRRHDWLATRSNETWALGNELLPVGGPKGTGLALVVEVLAGILSSAGFSDGTPADDSQGVCFITTPAAIGEEAA